MSEPTAEYILTMDKATSEKLGKLAEQAGYICDLTYLEEMINRIIEQRYEQMELLK